MGRLFANRQIDDPAISSLGMLAFKTDGDIYVVDYQLDADGLIQVDATTATNITGNGFDTVETHPSWSPDGTQLAFVRFVTDSTGVEFDQLMVFDFLLDQFMLVWKSRNPYFRPSNPPGRPTVHKSRSTAGRRLQGAKTTGTSPAS